jgi:diguanylate cyclase (GGDEF)-like protein
MIISNPEDSPREFSALPVIQSSMGNRVPPLNEGGETKAAGVIFEGISDRMQTEHLEKCHEKLEQQVKECSLLEQEVMERKRVEEALRQSEAELLQVNQELEYLVHIDSLTQVANRRCFDESLNREWQRSLREQQPLSLILWDIDYFKHYNDLYGHQAGDRCLVKIAQAVKHVLQRPTDLVARYGGEEFVVILPNTTNQGAIAVAQLIQKTILGLSTVHENSHVSNIVTTSLGIATVVPVETLQPDILVTYTDRALYEAKQQGRDRYVVYS